MINLPAKFKAENEKGKNTPAVIVSLQSDIQADEKYQQADWEANTAESNVDYTPTPPQSGEVELAEATGSLSQALIANVANFPLYRGDFIGQGFIVPTKDAYITSITLKVWDWPWGSSATMTVRTSQSGGILASKSQNVYIGSYEDVTFTFAVPIPVRAGVTYWFTYEFTDPQTYYEGEVRMRKNTPFASGYCFFYGSAGSGFYYQFYEYDLEFTINYKRYEDSGYIETDNFDLGETPIVDGELQVDDVTPGNSSLKYYLRGSDVGSFQASDTSSLGYYEDGDAIEDLYKFYRVRAEFLPTSDNLETSTLSKIRLDFSKYQKFSTHGNLALEPSVLNVSALETAIDDFEESTIGQITVRLDHTPAVSQWLATKKPKNKIVKILAGFVASGFEETDYINYFWGQIDDWSIEDDDAVSLAIRDFSTEWSKPVPETWTDSSDDITWTGSHHVDVLKDVFDRIGVRDSKLELNSFSEVKSEVPTYTVTRKITGDPVDGNDLANELRILLNAYFIPQPDGKIKLKRYDASEVASVILTDDDLLSGVYEANEEGLINDVRVYFGHVGSGDEAKDFPGYYSAIDSDSIVDNQETAEYELKDRWTTTANSQQIADMADAFLDRYKAPPPIIPITVDRKYIFVEPGDLVELTTSRAPTEYIPTGWTVIDTVNEQTIAARYSHGATIVDSEIYYFGGIGSGSNMLQDLVKYSPGSDLWTEVGTYSDERHDFGITAIGNDIFIHGGVHSGSPFATQDFFKYNVTSDIWTNISSSPTGLRGHRMQSIGNVFYLPAGFTGFDYTDRGYKYDSAVDTWTQIASFGNHPHRQDYSFVTYRAEFYLFGGMYSDAASVMNDLWKYNTDSDIWTQVTTAPFYRYDHDAAVSSDAMFVFGGSDADGIPSNELWKYSFLTGAWKQIESEDVPEIRTALALSEIGGNLFAFGGYTGSEYLNDLWQYAVNTITNGFESEKMQVIQRELDHFADTISLTLKKV